MNDLPNEIIFLILENLPVREMVSSATGINRKYYELSTCDTLWKRVIAKPFPYFGFRNVNYLPLYSLVENNQELLLNGESHGSIFNRFVKLVKSPHVAPDYHFQEVIAAAKKHKPLLYLKYNRNEIYDRMSKAEHHDTVSIKIEDSFFKIKTSIGYRHAPTEKEIGYLTEEDQKKVISKIKKWITLGKLKFKKWGRKKTSKSKSSSKFSQMNEEKDPEIKDEEKKKGGIGKKIGEFFSFLSKENEKDIEDDLEICEEKYIDYDVDYCDATLTIKLIEDGKKYSCSGDMSVDEYMMELKKFILALEENREDNVWAPEIAMGEDDGECILLIK